MSNTSLVLGMNWQPDEWPEYVSVIHESAIAHGYFSQKRRYVPERTCINFYKHADSPRFWCSECDFKSNWPISDGRAIEPRRCPNCGAKVVK